MSGAGKNYISAEEAASAVAWQLPQVGQGQRIPSAEKEAREREQREAEKAKESVEDVEPLALPSAEEIAAVLDAAREDGHQEGYQAGLEQGLEEGRTRGFEQGLAQSLAETERLQAQLRGLIEELSGPSAERQGALAELLVTLVTRLTQKLVYTELSVPSPHIENLVQACMQELPALKPGVKTTITLHPDDLAYLHGESLMSELMDRCDWRTDDTMQQGGCVVTTPASQLDARTETRLASVLQAFEQGQLATGDLGTELEQSTALDVAPASERAAGDSTPDDLSDASTSPDDPHVA